MSLDIKFENVVYSARSFSLFQRGTNESELKKQEFLFKKIRHDQWDLDDLYYGLENVMQSVVIHLWKEKIAI